jgi:hypothetical protein
VRCRGSRCSKEELRRVGGIVDARCRVIADARTLLGVRKRGMVGRDGGRRVGVFSVPLRS